MEPKMNQHNPWKPSSKPCHVIIQETLNNLQNHCSTFFNPQNPNSPFNHQNPNSPFNHQNPNSPFNNFPNPKILKTHFDSAVSDLNKRVIESGFSIKVPPLAQISQNSDTEAVEMSKGPNSPFNSFPNPKIIKTHIDSALDNLNKHVFGSGFSKKVPPLARISQNSDETKAVGMSKGEIEERLAGVPVYALSNASNEFVLVSGEKSGTSLGFFCFKEDDAVALLQQMRSMEPDMRDGSQVIPVALNKVVQLKLDGVSFRLIPELNQIKNALNEKRKTGNEEDSFKGVPVFQSKSLILRSQGKRYRPVFFRKEDLDKSLARASREQRRLNPAYREGEIEVAVLEDIIDGMKESAKSAWSDVVFIPPGFDVSTDPSHK